MWPVEFSVSSLASASLRVAVVRASSYGVAGFPPAVADQEQRVGRFLVPGTLVSAPVLRRPGRARRGVGVHSDPKPGARVSATRA